MSDAEITDGLNELLNAQIGVDEQFPHLSGFVADYRFVNTVTAHDRIVKKVAARYLETTDDDSMFAIVTVGKDPEEGEAFSEFDAQ